MTVRNEEKKPFRDLTADERSEIVEAISRGDVIDMAIDGIFQPVRMPGAIGMNSIYRTEQRKLKIPWHVIKPEYKWAAMDEVNNVFVYEYKPEMVTRGFAVKDLRAFVWLPLNIDTTGIDWRESLTERPEVV